jgi:hypothetical protein
LGAADLHRREPARPGRPGHPDPVGRPYRSFRGLLEHLATMTRNQVRFTGAQVTVPMLTEPAGCWKHLPGIPGR